MNSSLNSDHNRFTTYKTNNSSEQANNNNFIYNQFDVLNNQQNMLPPTFQQNYQTKYNINAGLYGLRQPANYLYQPPNQDRYDFQGDFLHQKGINSHNSLTRYKTTYVNVNSRYRNKQTYSIVDDYIQLENNPVQFNSSSKLITINQDDHSFEVTDKIHLTGVPNYKKIYNT